MRRILAALALTLTPALAQAETGCEAAWREGFRAGVADVQAQLQAGHAAMERQVEAQLNAQLAQLEAARQADMQDELKRAQAAALAEAVSTPMPPALTGAAPAPTQGLAPGSRIVIENAETLPPELLEALLAYLAR